MQTTVFFPYKDISETGMKRAVSSNYYHHAKMEDVSESSLNVLPEAGSDIKKKISSVPSVNTNHSTKLA